MWKYGKVTAFLLAGMLCLSLGACGGEETGPGYAVGGSSANTENGEKQVSDGQITFVEKEEEFLCFTEEVAITLDSYPVVSVWKDCLYYGDGQALNSYSFVDGSLSTRELKWANAPAKWKLYQSELDSDGNVYGIVTAKETTGTLTYVCKFDVNGEAIYAYNLTDDLEQNDRSSWSSNWRTGVDAEGRFYLADDDLMWIINAEGTQKDSVSIDKTSDFTIGDIARTADGRLHITYNGGISKKCYIGELTPDFEGKGGEDAVSYQEKVMVNGMETMGESGLLVYDRNGAYQYDLAEQTFTQMFSWENAGVEGDRIIYAGILTDGRVVAVTYGNSSHVYLVESLTKAQAEKKDYIANKTDIVIGTLSDDLFLKDLKNAMASFNRNSDKYNVIIEDYRGDAVDAEAAYNRLNSELVSGKGPDLLEFGNFEDFARNGAVENLYDYLEKSESLSKEDFFANLLAEYDENGILTAIPREIQLSTIIGSSKVVGEEMGWTLDDMIALGEQYPDKQVYYENTLTKRGILIYFIRFYGEQFLDWENGTCNFDTEDFRKLLKFMEQFPDEYPPPGENEPSIYTKLGSGEILTTRVSFVDFRRIQPYEEVLGGDLTFIGFPAPEGAGCWLSDYDALAINSNSKCKEGAWEFIEFLLQYDNGEIAMSGFPSYKPLYEKCLQESMTDSRSSMMHTNDGWSFQYHTTTQEEADKILALIENAQYTMLDVDMVNIIIEEADVYFAGQKDMDTVIGIVQNRVQNYMSEQK